MAQIHAMARTRRDTKEPGHNQHGSLSRRSKNAEPIDVNPSTPGLDPEEVLSRNQHFAEERGLTGFSREPKSSATSTQLSTSCI